MCAFQFFFPCCSKYLTIFVLILINGEPGKYTLTKCIAKSGETANKTFDTRTWAIRAENVETRALERRNKFNNTRPRTEELRTNTILRAILKSASINKKNYFGHETVYYYNYKYILTIVNRNTITSSP